MTLMTLRQITLSHLHPWRSYGIYLIACMVVLLPLFFPGYILSLDMVFAPHIAMPQHITSSYAFYALLHFANYIIPSMVLQKIMLLSILLFSMVGMHKLIYALHGRIAALHSWHVYITSIIYAINPFTYSRFMAGQFAVLLGYMLLPWFVLVGLRFYKQPNLTNAVSLGLVTTIIGIVSIHTLGLIAVLCTAAFVAIVAYRPRRNLRPYLKPSGIAIATFLVTSSYWLVPLLLGKGKTAEAIGSFTASDISAFATAGNTILERIVYITQLRGFWAEERDLFLLPPEVFPLWGLAVIIFWVLIGNGLTQIWRSNKRLATFISFAIIAATLLALGIPFIWLNEHIPLAMGFREPHKFVGIIALCFSLCAAKGISYILSTLKRRGTAIYAVGAVTILLLPYTLTPTMALGFNGQLQPRHYPADWSAVNQQLNADRDTFAVLFLPWHQYMSYRFAGRIIASPAEPFFDKPMIVSADPEMGGAIATNSNKTYQRLDRLLANAPNASTLGLQLKTHNIKYILLAKDLDYRDYKYLDNQHDLSLVSETEHLKLYRNQAWSQP